MCRGQGLGRHGTGMVTHIKIEKKEENEGLGWKEDKARFDAVGDVTWVNAYKTNKKIGGAAAVDSDDSDTDSSSSDDEKIRSGQKRSRRSAHTDSDTSSSDTDSDSDAGGRGRETTQASRDVVVVAGGIVLPSFDELFKATGGARLGMRARRAQPGKIARAEGEVMKPTMKHADEEEAKSSKKSKKDKKEKKEKKVKEERKEAKEEGRKEKKAKKSKKEVDS